ncbi:MAG: hypothetical protein AB7O43_16515, partial [Hyphomicrobiaceae bacterium]
MRDGSLSFPKDAGFLAARATLFETGMPVFEGSKIAVSARDGLVDDLPDERCSIAVNARDIRASS